jgi:molybdopterin molybdotransferase
MMGTKAEFFNVQPVNAALDMLSQHWTPQRRTEKLDTRQALGRVLAAAPLSPMHLPSFRRSTMDGYAVRAADTYGASQSLPAYLTCAGTVSMGTETTGDIQSGQAVLIHTGGMLPVSADAVVMIERTQTFGENEIEVLSPVAPGENVVQVGEDVSLGEAILPTGHRLRPQDIGGLLAVGILSVEVMKAPHVGILSSGDELVTPDEHPAPGQVRDINAYTLSGLVQEAGGEPVLLGIARDESADFQARAQAGFQCCDMLVITAGSSVSTRDLTCEIISSLGKPGILQHGLAVKPGKPTITAVCDNRPVIGLPGNPVSAFLVARQIVVPLIRRFLNQAPLPTTTQRATLANNIPSTSGREDTVPVRLIEQNGTFMAEPVFGKSNLIYTLVKADGLLHIPLNQTGLKAGTTVEVILF